MAVAYRQTPQGVDLFQGELGATDFLNKRVINPNWHRATPVQIMFETSVFISNA